jgi:hypothetical protein
VTGVPLPTDWSPLRCAWATPSGGRRRRTRRYREHAQPRILPGKQMTRMTSLAGARPSRRSAGLGVTLGGLQSAYRTIRSGS